MLKNNKSQECVRYDKKDVEYIHDYINTINDYARKVIQLYIYLSTKWVQSLSLISCSVTLKPGILYFDKMAHTAFSVRLQTR